MTTELLIRRMDGFPGYPEVQVSALR